MTIYIFWLVSFCFSWMTSMDIKITETLHNRSDNKYIKGIEIKCPGCKKELHFEVCMIDYCSALYCPYYQRRFDVDEIIKSIKNLI